MSLTSEEKAPPIPVSETVPEGPVEPERSFLADPVEEKTGSTFIDAGVTNIVDEDELGGIDEIQRFEPRLSADPFLTSESIQGALINSFEMKEDGQRLVPVTDEPLELPFGELLTEALGRARSEEEVDRIKNSFYSAVNDLLPDNDPRSKFRNQINASVDVYFSNLKPYVDYDDENEFEQVVEEDLTPPASPSSGLTVVRREPREVIPVQFDPDEQSSEFKEALASIPGVSAVPTPRALVRESSEEAIADFEEALEEESLFDTDDEDWEPESFLDIGDTIEGALEGDVLRLYQAEEVGDGKQDAIDFAEAYEDVLNEFRSQLQSEARERPLDEKDEKEIKMVISEVPNRSLQHSMMDEFEEVKAAQRYDREELEDLPPHILQPHSLKVRYRDYKQRGPTGVIGLQPEEVDLAEAKQYTRSGELTDKGRTVWIGPNGGQWVYDPRTKNFVNARAQPKEPGSLEGELEEYYRDSPEEIEVKGYPLNKVLEFARLHNLKPAWTQQDLDRLLKTTSKNLRPDKSKNLGQIQIQWSTGQNQRDILVPASAQFEDVVKLAEILRVEEGRLLDLDARELFSIKKDTPLSAIISFFQTMLAANAGHDLHLVFLPGKGRGSGLYLGGALMSLFKPPLVPHKEYHSTPGSRYKEYLSRLPLSSFSRHHRNPGGALRTGGGRPHGAPPGHGWSVRVPKTIQPYEFANVGAFPLPQRGFWDDDALDRDPKALSTPFGPLPAGLGGPYGWSEEGIGGNIAARVQGWRVTPRGKGKHGGAKVSDVATGIAGVSGALASTGVGTVVAAPLAAVSGIVAGLGKVFGF